MPVLAFDDPPAVIVAQAEPDSDGVAEADPGCVNPPLVILPSLVNVSGDGNATNEERRAEAIEDLRERLAIEEERSAVYDNLVAVQSEIQAYMAAVEEYIECVDAELEEAGGDDSAPLFQSLMVTRHNQAVTEMEQIADAFNQQVRAYQEATTSDEGEAGDEEEDD